MNFPCGVKHIMETLTRNGYESYVVGGAVRDILLGQTPHDYDIASSATPDTVMKLFPHVIPTGIKHGTVTVIINGEGFEVTMFRTDGEYLDGRRPEQVFFTDSIVEDLSRRDFTINGLGMSICGTIADPFGGRKDLSNGVIKAVGDAKKRFMEDKLRMLRAIRFSAKLDFSIEENTLIAIKECAHLIIEVSPERIRDELNKILLTNNAEKAFVAMHETGLLKQILPDIDALFGVSQENPHHVYDVAVHTLKAVEAVEANAVLRWVMLLHDAGKVHARTFDDKGIAHFFGHPEVSAEIARKILNDLRFSNAEINSIIPLVRHHDVNVVLEEGAVIRFLRKIGENLFSDYLKVVIADAKAQNPKFFADKECYVESLKQIYEAIKTKQSAMTLKDLALRGNDIMFVTEKKRGLVLKRCLEMVTDFSEKNNKESLLEYANYLIESGEV